MQDSLLLLVNSVAPVLLTSISPWLALTVLSALGVALNADLLALNHLPWLEYIAQLPLAQLPVFLLLLVLLFVKYVLECSSFSKLMCDATLGKLETVLGYIISGAIAAGTVGDYTSVPSYLEELGYLHLSSMSMLPGVTSLLSLLMWLLASFAYFVLRTAVSALNSLTNWLAPIPFLTAIFSTLKYVIALMYTWLIIVYPWIAAIIGLSLFAASCAFLSLLFRLQRFYRCIYLEPLISKLFKHRPPLLKSTTLPKRVIAYSSDAPLIIEMFALATTQQLKKWQRCYLVSDTSGTYVLHQKFPWSSQRLELPEGSIIASTFVMVKINNTYGLSKTHAQQLDNIVGYTDLVKLEKNERNPIHAT